MLVKSNSPFIAREDIKIVNAAIDSLSKREKPIVRLVMEGMTTKEIANELGVTEKAIKYHLTHIFEKFEVKSKIQLILTLSGLARPQKKRLGEALYTTPTEPAMQCPVIELRK